MKINITLEELISDFKIRSQISNDKKALLEREIDCYEYIFHGQYTSPYQSRFGITITIPGFREQFNEYSEDFNEFDIYKIRSAYNYFVGYKDYKIEAPFKFLFYSEFFRGENVSEEELESKATALAKAAMVYNDYLQWLKKELSKKYRSKFPDKYYAWYHKIRIAIGKADQFTTGAMQEIINYGKNEYGTKGHGFYQAFLDFDLTKPAKFQDFVTNLSAKDRKGWKQIIGDISCNDIDVTNYLKKFPN